MTRKTVESMTRIQVHYAFEHEGRVTRVRDRVELMAPGLMAEIVTPQAANAIWLAWCEAEFLVLRIFRKERPAEGYRSPKVATYTRIAFGGDKLDTSIVAKTAEESPLRAGRIIVRLGTLMIVCDSLDAWRSQHSLWRQAYDLSRATWPGEVRFPNTLARWAWERSSLRE